MVKNSNRVVLFRHGETKYRQREVSLAEAYDLTEVGIAEVIGNTESLAVTVGRKTNVFVFSSPLGRSLHSAKLISQVLREYGLRAANEDIIIVPNLTEVRNFSWPLFCPLVQGGEIEFAGSRFLVDSAKTNPQQVSVGEYFNEDYIRKIPPRIRRELPPWYVNIIDSFEKFASVSARLLEVLRLISCFDREDSLFIISTHDALAGFPAEVYSGKQLRGLPTGSFVDMKLSSEGVFVQDIPGFAGGNSNLELFETYKQRFA